MVVDMRADRLEVALPEGFEDHPVGRLRAFEEAGDVELRIGGEQCAHPGPGGRQIGEVAIVGDRRRLRAGAWTAARLDPRVGVGGLQDRLFMAGALAEHGIEPKADEQGDQGKDDDGGQDSISDDWGTCQHNAP